MDRFLGILTVVLIIGATVFAQRPEPTLFDQFGVISCEDLRGRLDSFMSDVARSRDSQGVVVAYEGRFTRYRGEQAFKVLPMFGELQLIIKAFRNHFIFRRFDPKRIIFLSGGYRDDFEIESGLYPRAGLFPRSNPLLIR
jgi:hypothetical protein